MTKFAPAIKADIPWQQRQHSSSVSTRYFSGGWEFVTTQDARDYISQQYARETLADRRNTTFRSTVNSNGVSTLFADGHDQYGIHARVATKTYTIPANAESIRDRVTIDSPSDCVWLVPGTGEEV